MRTTRMAAVGAVGLAVMGCSAPVAGGADGATAGEEPVARTSQALAGGLDNIVIGSGLCSKKASENLAGQAYANALVRYLLGSTAPLPSGVNSTIKKNLDVIRARLVAGTVTAYPVDSVVTLCGLRAATRSFHDAETDPTYYTSPLARAASAIYQNGDTSLEARMFWFSKGEAANLADPNAFFVPFVEPHTGNVALDPEPAQVRASLSGSAGASAAAVYVNSQAATTVVKWSAGYALGGANPPTAGAPCTTVDLKAGAQATQAIFRNGGYYKCL